MWGKPEIGLPVGEESAQLVAGSHQQIWLAIVVNDQRNCLEEDGVLGIRVLYLLGLWCVLGLVQNALQAFLQTSSVAGIL
jgi:hypothetical protein